MDSLLRLSLCCICSIVAQDVEGRLPRLQLVGCSDEHVVLQILPNAWQVDQRSNPVPSKDRRVTNTTEL